ncbi:MAG TPA: hypothetical protein VJL35_01150 [Gemmatimonadaceae bacterium]|nr:hypothetical protein [Gemmatimonadaceae bacterium]
MTRIHIVPQPHPAMVQRSPERHSTMREGISLGLIVGAATWLWLAGFDFVRGEPFHTFNFLGGIATFSLVHFVLCLAYGFTIISALHASMKEPTIMFGIIFSAILFQAAVVIVTAMLANIGIGQLAWGKFFVGNAVAACLTFVWISRNHSLKNMFEAAEALQKD